MTESSPAPRRRRRRARRGAEPEQPAAGQPAGADRSDQPTPVKPRRRAAAGRGAEGQPGRDSDRGWRDLLGNAPSQVGVSGAMRARDVARPGPDELLAAERELQIVRRQWKPPEDAGR
jgi:hypothetical protein